MPKARAPIQSEFPWLLRNRALPAPGTGGEEAPEAATAGGGREVNEFSSTELAAIYCDLFQRRWGFPATGAERLAEVLALLKEFLIGSVLFLNDAPIAVQLVYRVESPEWISIEYVNGGVDPETRAFSPGSVLSFLNTQSAWEQARAVDKPLRFSFGRADREYKERWCNPVPVFSL